MRECFNKYFFLDGSPLKCTEFPMSMVYSGESVYEVIRIIKGKPLFLKDHLQRLRDTLKIRSKKINLSDREIIKQVIALVNINKVDLGNIKLVFNFGEANEGISRFLVYFIEHHYPSDIQIKNGVKTILFEAERAFPNAKIINQHLRSTIFKKLLDTRAYEALLVDKSGFITEGSRSNVFFIKDNEIFTSPDRDVLSGIARKYVLEIAKSNGIEVEFRKISVSKIAVFSAVFITGTSPGVLPVSKIEDFRFDPQNELLLKIIKHYGRLTDTL